MKDSYGNEVVRSLLASDVYDSFLDGREAISLSLILGSSNNAMLDVYNRFDELENALLNLAASNGDSSAAEQAKNVRDKMLPLEIETQMIEGDSPEIIQEHISEEHYEKSYATGISQTSDFNSLELTISIDTSYDRDDRRGLRVFTSSIEEIIHLDSDDTIIVKMQDSIDNFDVMERINKTEKMIDKLLSTRTKSGSFNKSTLKQAMKLRNTNAINAN